MERFENMFHLTKDEARAIYGWLKEIRYDSSKDTFKIIFEPTCMGEICVSVAVITSADTVWLELYDDTLQRVPCVDSLLLGDYIFDLEISEEHYMPFIPILNKSVEAQVNADIDPTISFVFIITNGICEVYVAGTKLGCHALLKFSQSTGANSEVYFNNISKFENNILCKGIHAEWSEKNIPYFYEKDMSVLLDRLYIFGYNVYGIECWSSVDMSYFRSCVNEIYLEKQTAPQKEWFLDAFKMLTSAYAELVLSEEPDNSPFFNVSFGR